MEPLTKDDLRQFGIELLYKIEELITKKIQSPEKESAREWIRSKEVRSILNICPTTLQNIRIARKIRYKKVLGSYYYNLPDLKKLFEDGKI
ncbi:DNA-binding protein [Elizabethkingia anophelis]|nr:DNA-binding protein [Elizabethkingia anophelis]